jgi:hypothetical protein
MVYIQTEINLNSFNEVLLLDIDTFAIITNYNMQMTDRITLMVMIWFVLDRETEHQTYE